MNSLAFRRPLSRTLIVLLILAAQSLLPALSHANLPDPTWIPGIYDDADDDNLILFLSSAGGSAAPADPGDLGPPPPIAGMLDHSREGVPLTLPASALRPRAPPAL